MNVNIKQLIHGFADVYGVQQTKIIHGVFDITDSSDIILQTYCGKDDSNKDILIDSNKIPNATIGSIKDNNNPVVGVKVSFIKDYIVLNKKMNEYGATQAVVDYCITDNNGNYTVFIEPGIYTIRIDGGQNPKIFTNQEITDGLQNQYYYLIDKGLIKKKYNDIIEFYGTNKKLVQGVMLDQSKRPIINAEIIISQDNIVKTYIKTDLDGKYSFAIENTDTDTTYDIRIRGPQQPIKILKGFKFENGKGFVNVLNETNNLFKGEYGIWICQQT